MGRVDPIGVEYIEFEVAGGRNSVRHGGGDWLVPKIRKLSRRGSGLASEMRMGWFLGIEDPIVEKYIGFEEGGLRFGEASFMLVSTHSCSSPLVCSPPFVLLVCVFVCAHPHSFLLVFAHLFVLVPTTWSSQPLICVCLKYIVSKYIIAKQLTFIPWIINLDKSY